MNNKILEIIKNFKFNGTLTKIEENNQGNINTSYILTFTNNNKITKYILQKINSFVFKDPLSILNNIELVIDHINKTNTLQTNYKTITFIKTKNNESIYKHVNNCKIEYYRAYQYIENSISYNNLNEAKNNKKLIAYNAGKTIGYFHKLLDTLPINNFSETIQNFHNTPLYFNKLQTSIKDNKINNKLLDEISSRIEKYSSIYNNLGKTIPIKITHNDTKLNNILFDKQTFNGLALIDLDTIMPGSRLFDIGDGVRSTCANCNEDETNENLIFLDMDLTKEYINGYLSETYNILEQEELNNITNAIKTITYELAIRFLTDFLNGNIYFKIAYQNHNFDRFKNQFILLKDIERKSSEIEKYIKNIYNQLKKEH